MFNEQIRAYFYARSDRIHLASVSGSLQSHSLRIHEAHRPRIETMHCGMDEKKRHTVFRGQLLKCIDVIVQASFQECGTSPHFMKG